MPALTGPVGDERAYVECERSILAMLATRHPSLDPDSRRDLYHEAWASVLKRRSEGIAVENLRAYLLGAADKLASKRVYGADARRRQTFDPTSEGFVGLADVAELPEERALAADEARRLHMLVDELEDTERALFKLRLDLGLEPSEIRHRLDLTDRQYRRIAERGGKALLAQFRAFDRGDWARGKRSLLCACVMGIASETQRARAQELVASDPCCRAMMGELRELGGGAAALLPLPVGAAAVGGGSVGPAERFAELLATTRGRVADLTHHPLPGSGSERGPRPRALEALSNARPDTAETLVAARRHASEVAVGAKQHAANLLLRVTDPTPVAGVRPGAAAALVASCIAAGGGVYCAAEGIPDAIRPVTGIERSHAQSEATLPKHPAQAESQPPVPPVAPTPTPNPAPPDKPEAQQPVQAPAAAPSAPAASPAPAPTPREEFEPSAQPASPQSPTSPPPAPRAAAPTPASGASGEFGP